MTTQRGMIITLERSLKPTSCSMTIRMLVVGVRLKPMECPNWLLPNRNLARMKDIALDVGARTVPYTPAQFVVRIRKLAPNHPAIILQRTSKTHPRSLVDLGEHQGLGKEIEASKEFHLLSKTPIRNRNNSSRRQMAITPQTLVLSRSEKLHPLANYRMILT